MIPLDEYLLEICAVVSTRSTCKRRQFGAVVVKNGQVLSTGYNGAPKGMPHCTEIGCLRDQYKFQVELAMKFVEQFTQNKMRLSSVHFMVLPQPGDRSMLMENPAKSAPK